MPIVYASEDDGTLYLESEVDVDNKETGYAQGYNRYEIPEVITLTAKQVCGSYGAIVEILSRAGVLKNATR